jgi:Ni,Fe-hydrogenase III large subunit
LTVGWIIKEIDPAKVFQAVQYMAFDYLGGVEMGLPKKLQSIFINAVKKYERSSKKILQNLSRSVSLRRRNSTALIGQEVAMAASALTIVKQLRGVASELTQ